VEILTQKVLILVFVNPKNFKFFPKKVHILPNLPQK